MKLLAAIPLIASLGLSFHSEALAQSSGDRAAAQALFDEGQRLMQSKEYAEACDKFEASLGLVAGLGTRGRLAQCYEKAGKTASAWAAFRQVADLAKKANDNKRYVAADRYAKELAKQLSYVTFVVAEPTPGMQLYRDGATLALGVLGTPIAIDPGAHTLEVRAEGYETWTHSFSVGAKEKSSVDIPALEKKPELIAPVDPAQPGPGLSMRSGPDATDTSPMLNSGPTSASESGTKTTGLIVAGGGGVLVGGAVVMAILADQKWTGAFDDGDCVAATNICNEAGKNSTDSARTLSTVSLVVGSVGLAAAAAGTYLWLRGPKEAQQASISLTPTASPTGAGISITGSY